MQQRVAIARSLAVRPQVLLMDEPFGALDAQTRNEMQDLLLRIWDETAATVLFVTHDVAEAVFLADRMYIVSARPGTIVEDIPVPFGRPRDQGLKETPRVSGTGSARARPPAPDRRGRTRPRQRLTLYNRVGRRTLPCPTKTPVSAPS